MVRGARKSQLEKLKEELQKTQNSIEQYKAAIVTLKDKEKQLQDEIQAEEFRDISSLLSEKNMSIAELKELISAQIEVPKDE